MDYQHRVGYKTGSGGPATAQEIALDRKERLRRLGLETVDLSKDPYLRRNHVGKIECRLCLSVHLNEASYLTHSQGRKHQTNLARRAAKEQAASTSAGVVPQPPPPGAADMMMNGSGDFGFNQMAAGMMPVKTVGRPAYRVTKLRDPAKDMFGIRLEVLCADIEPNTKPMHRFRSTWEQHMEPPNRNWQYLVVAAEPYETIALKIQAGEIHDLVHSWKAPHFEVQFLIKIATEEAIADG